MTPQEEFEKMTTSSFNQIFERLKSLEAINKSMAEVIERQHETIDKIMQQSKGVVDLIESASMRVLEKVVEGDKHVYSTLIKTIQNCFQVED